jgi:CRISPR-associated endonuclease/helicase Cas3
MVGDAQEQSVDFAAWFKNFSGHPPHPWQVQLAVGQHFSSRLIRIPTGFGKTFGGVGAWAFHRVVLQRPDWPRRLVYCLPMRVLVEQTEAEIRQALERVGLLRTSERPDGVAVHVLLGGSTPTPWHLDVTGHAILIGTQDMLLSRALNRGYASHRARWPVEFGLLNHDVLWILDEVQLMDVGLATSAQMQAFRDADGDAARLLRPTASWWMSATLQPAWLASVDTAPMVADRLEPTTCRIPAELRTGRLWTDVAKPIAVAVASGAKAIAPAVASQIIQRWADLPSHSLGLAVLNTVDRAVAVYQVLVKTLADKGVDIRLVHSRFRPAERLQWREEFLSRGAAIPMGGRIIVATQVVEAGVDIDARLLVSEIAPWSSMVQRFGRVARGGGVGTVVVVDGQLSDDKGTAPYAARDLQAAAAVFADGGLGDVAPLALEAFEEALSPQARAALYPYQARQLLLRRDLEDLFDTTTDLSGGDLDVGRWIRSGEDRDCLVAWIAPTNPTEGPTPDIQPARDEL